MRLHDYSLHVYALRYERPIQWSDIVEEAAPYVLLRLQDDMGAVGVAEVTVKPTWCGVNARTLTVAVEDIFMPILAQIDLTDPVQVRRTLDRIPENTAAKTLIDNACWDLYAARSGQSLRGHWGGSGRVEVSWALTRQPPQAMANEAETMVARHGFRTIKVKGGQGIAVDRAVMKAIRDAVGDRIRLYVDANGAYPYAEAADYVRAMADFGAEMVEDPCVTAPDGKFRQLQEVGPVPVLVDFGCTSIRDAASYIANGTKALSLKPGRFGLTDSRAMLQLADAASCHSIAGLMGESTVGTFLGLQFASILHASPLPAELSGYLGMTEHVTTTIPKIENGEVQLPDSASVASMVDFDAVEFYGQRGQDQIR
ncbi:MAG: hypothetical protein GC182_12245 [Rhodopseudomonas sp.]|nr:hypothetical protein [Rhodopseudomonas sp.]